ncbi:MAG: hypothetical protein M3337_05505 [Actinomycetota bacterium]|nr:hypothetical protein [Actinomycetota bacterium]
MEPDLDAIERQLVEVENTLDRLEDGSFWSDPTGTIDRPGDVTAEHDVQDSVTDGDTAEQPFDATPVNRPAPARTDQ